MVIYICYVSLYVQIHHIYVYVCVTVTWLSLIQAVSKCGWWGHELKARDTTIIFAVSIAYSQCIYIIIYESKEHECDDEHLNLSEPFALMFSISSNQWLTVSHSEMAKTRRFTKWSKSLPIADRLLRVLQLQVAKISESSQFYDIKFYTWNADYHPKCGSITFQVYEYVNVK